MRKAGPRRTIEAERADEAIGRQRCRSQHLGEAARAEPAAKIHLPQPILGMHEALREERVGRLAPRRAASAMASRTMLAGAASPRTRISPSTTGSDWRSQR